MQTPTAFSPGSATCFFRPTVGASPLATYSRGCAINLDHGVTAAVRPNGSMQTILNGRVVTIAPVQRLIEALAPEPVCVEFETRLPLGCGFGVSAACCLTAAFAIAHRFELERSRHELGMLAHEAEVTCRTGFGDVASQLCGGVVHRICKRGPLDAERLNATADSLHYYVSGELRTAAILSDPEYLARIATTGDAALRWLDDLAGAVTVAGIMDRSIEFAQDSGLLTSERVRTAIGAVRASGGHAMMVMLGQSVLATQPAEGIGPWTSCKIDAEGTRFLP